MKYLLVIAALMLHSPLFAADCSPIPQPTYNPATYYSPAEGLQGSALKNALNNIIRGHQDYSYTPCMWDMLSQADEDPNNPDAVIGLYTRRSILKVDRDRGGNTPDNWNREHSWPKSHGFSSSSQDAYRDGHHLRASDKSVNADRGSDDFAAGGSPNSECNGCFEGNGTWEPPNVVKGDIARMMFYMDVRYEGNDNSGTPDLELVDRLTSSSENRLGRLCELVQWHIDDPVSAEEQNRNDVIYSWQGNRNPFIDHPEYVLPIWGDTCGIQPPPPAAPQQVPIPWWSLLLMALGSVMIVLRVFNKKSNQ